MFLPLSHRHHEVQEQPWHPEDGSCSSQTLRANPEVKGNFFFFSLKWFWSHSVKFVEADFKVTCCHLVAICKTTRTFFLFLHSNQFLHVGTEPVQLCCNSATVTHGVLVAGTVFHKLTWFGDYYILQEYFRSKRFSTVIHYLLAMVTRFIVMLLVLDTQTLVSSVWEPRRSVGQLVMLKTCRPASSARVGNGIRAQPVTNTS